MGIKKCLSLVLAMLMGVTQIRAYAGKHDGITRISPENQSEATQDTDFENGEPEKKRMKSFFGDGEFGDFHDQNMVFSHENEELSQLPICYEDYQFNDEPMSSMEEYPVQSTCVDALTPNGREIVRSLHSGYGFNLDIVEPVSAEIFKQRIHDVYECVRQEPALCVAPQGTALVIDNLCGDLARTRESILAARIAFETGKAGSVVFLGNYANMGDFCVETLNEIFKLKLEFPNKVFLISGNQEAKFLETLEMIEHSEFLSDVRRKFSKEDADIIIKQIVDELFKSLPIAVEVPLSTGESALCLYGNLPRLISATGEQLYDKDRMQVFINEFKKWSVGYFYSGKNLFIFCSVLGLGGNFKIDQSNLNLVLNLTGCKYLVKYGDDPKTDIVKEFDGRCYEVNHSLVLITAEGIRPLCEGDYQEVISLEDWNKRAVRDFVLAADGSDPDVLVGWGILSSEAGDNESTRNYYEEAMSKGSNIACYELGKCYLSGRKAGCDYCQALKLYEWAAEQGNVWAQYALGSCYALGYGTINDMSKAAKWYRLAAEHGHAKARFDLGICCATGRGESQCWTQAAKWYRLAAEQGIKEAQCEIGSCYKKGKGVKQDYDQALKWYFRSAAKDFARAQFAIGLCYERGQGVDKSDSKAIYWYRLAANQGYVIAQNALGVCYTQGKGVAQDYSEALKWFEAAANGCASAKFNLGLFYAGGKGVSQDWEQAAVWFRRAADMGMVQALNNLGVCYEHGYGVTKDQKKAADMYLLATKRGNVKAQWNLGMCYAIGKGIAQDYKKAVICFRSAAAGGNVQALCDLGVCYEYGYGVTQKYHEAFKCYCGAAAKECVNAKFGLGVCYEHGYGVAQNYDEAVKWYRLAAEQGHIKAKRRLTRLLRLQKKK